MRRRILLIAALALLPAQTAAPPKPGPINAEAGLALAGHDPVAYFTEARPTPGDPAITAGHGGVTYRFASEANRAAFLADPPKYLPQYGGYCAFAVARGYKAIIDPAAFAVVGGKLYLNYNADIAAQWAHRRDAEIRRADANWPSVMHSPELAR